MKKGVGIVLGLLLGFSNLSCYCQDARAVELLQESESKFGALQDFSADMLYEISNPTGNRVAISKKGKLFFAKGKYRLRMDKQEVYFDGQTLWIHLFAESPYQEELQILADDPEEGIGLLQLFPTIFDPNWLPEYLGTETLEDTLYEKVSISSGNADLDIYRVNLWINASSHFLEKIVTIDRAQTRTSYEFSNLLVDQDLPESTFAFDTSNFQGEIFDERE